MHGRQACSAEPKPGLAAEFKYYRGVVPWCILEGSLLFPRKIACGRDCPPHPPPPWLDTCV